MPYGLRKRPFSSHSWIVQIIRPGSHILDIGCATGYLAYALASKQCTVVGVEMNPKAAKRARLTCCDVHELNVEQAGLSIVQEEVSPNPIWIPERISGIWLPHRINYELAKTWRELFAQQFILVAQIK